MKKVYKIGTRGSLLAVTQCTQTKELLEEKTGHRFELVQIKTQGDLNTSAPLWQLEGKDFFTKELDYALCSKEVDLVVHSYKDLGSDRPTGIKLGAITKRTFSQDILLIKNKTIKKLQEKNFQKDFVVGTSSPRRICNIESTLSLYLPFGLETNIKVTTSMLRGNVNTRIEKLVDDQYDAIVLAWAGLERLALTDSSALKLRELIKDLNFMVLPQIDFPSAASQGALAIECRDSDNEIQEILAKVHCEDTAHSVGIERKIFNSYGGGCHLAVGIYADRINDIDLTYEKGKVDEKVINKKILHRSNSIGERPNTIFIGLATVNLKKYQSLSPIKIVGDELILKSSIDPKEDEVLEGDIIASTFYTHKYLKRLTQNSLLWTAGARTAKKLANLGYWVSGCAGAHGEIEIDSFINSKLVRLFKDIKKIPSQRKVLTNKNSKTKIGEVVEAYQRKLQVPSDSTERDLKEVEAFFWTSAFQYKTYVDKYPFIKDKKHACGPGKTLRELTEAGVLLEVFSDIESFVNWQ